MGWPQNPVLDDFNRADQGPPPGSNWGTGYNGVNSGMSVVSNHLHGPGVSPSGSNTYWLTAFPADCELYWSLLGDPNLEGDLYYRLNDFLTASTADGYKLRVLSGLSFEIDRMDNATATVLKGADLGTGFFGAGDVVGMTVIGSTHTAMYKAAGSAAVVACQTTDATYSGSGSAVLRCTSVNPASPEDFDDFGGGPATDVTRATPTGIFAAPGVVAGSEYLNISSAGAASGAAPASAASAWGFGSWVDILTSGWPFPIEILGAVIQLPANATTATTFEQLLEIGTGAAGAESTRAQLPYTYRNVTNAEYVGLPQGARLTGYLSTPIEVGPNVRVAVRAADSLTSAITYGGVKVLFRELPVRKTDGVRALAAVRRAAVW